MDSVSKQTEINVKRGQSSETRKVISTVYDDKRSNLIQRYLFLYAILTNFDHFQK